VRLARLEPEEDGMRKLRNISFVVFLVVLGVWTQQVLFAGTIVDAWVDTMEEMCTTWSTGIEPDSQSGDGYCQCDPQDENCMNYAQFSFCGEALDAYEEYCNECVGCIGLMFSDCYGSGSTAFRDYVCRPSE
jgi:hypothetical protein